MTFLLFDDHIEKAEETFARVLQKVYASTDKPPFASHSQSDSPRKSVIRPQDQVSEYIKEVRAEDITKMRMP